MSQADLMVVGEQLLAALHGLVRFPHLNMPFRPNSEFI